jgi:signal transduction histidine kinase
MWAELSGGGLQARPSPTQEASTMTDTPRDELWRVLNQPRYMAVTSGGLQFRVDLGDPARLLAAVLQAATQATVCGVANASDPRPAPDDDAGWQPIAFGPGAPQGASLPADRLPARIVADVGAAILAATDRQQPRALPLPTPSLAAVAKADRDETANRLSAAFTHEVSTPLGVARTALSLALDAAAEEGAELSAILETLKLVDANMERAAELLHRAKTVAADLLSDRQRTVDLGELVKDALASLKPVFRAGRIQLHSRAEGDVTVCTRPGCVLQILHNAVENAACHAWPEGVPGNLTISVVGGTDGVDLRIEDDGVGMTPEIAARAIEPFYTTRTDGGGTGLGLHFLRHAAEELLGGSMHIEASPGGGTTVGVHLPREAPSAA